MCRYCDSEVSRYITGTKWDSIIGNISQVECVNGPLDLEFIVSDDAPTHGPTHLYCYLVGRPGSARIRYGFSDAQIALNFHENPGWQVSLMTENDLLPMCAQCTHFITQDTLVTLHTDIHSGIAYWGSSETGLFHAHKDCLETCSHCESQHLRSRMIRLESARNIWNGCRACYASATRSGEIFDCTCCGSTYSSPDLAWEDNGYYACVFCEDSIVACEDCGVYYSPEHGRHYHEVINEYGHKPRPRFQPDERQPYYLGYELEVEVEEDEDKYVIAEDVLRRVNNSLTDGKFVYLKDDGSLANGFEIVTHPFTLEFHQQFDLSFLDRLKDQGVRSWDMSTCGFHVHVSRSAFTARNFSTGFRRYSKAHEVRFTSLIYLNSEKFVRFAGRHSADYASFNSEETESVPEHVLLKAQGREHARMQAVNVQNSTTIEVRIFRGTLKRERILANLEMVHACVEYTRNLGSVAKAFGKNTDVVAPHGYEWSRFRSWLLANERVYPHANQYITSLSL